MIKVFTTGENPENAGHRLSSKFEEWVKTFEPNTIEIINIHTNSNKYGWMLTIHYKIIIPEKEGTMISDWLNEHGNPEILKKVEREAILKYGEPKQETLEEAAERLSKNAYKKHSVKDDKLSLDEQIQRSGGFIVGFKEGMIEGAKWQQERMYSEEEAYTIWKAGQEYWKTSGASITFEELTEQFKKK